MNDKPYTFDRVIRMAITFGILWILFMLMKALSQVLIPFFVAALLAYLINPLVSFMQKKLKSRGLSIALTLLLLNGLVAGILVLLLPAIGDEFAKMKNLISQNMGRLQEIEAVPDNLQKYIKDYVHSDEFQAMLTTDNISALAQKVLPGFWKGLSGLFGALFGLMGLITILLYLIFILIDFDAITAGWKNLVPPKFRKHIVELAEDLEDGMNGYFKAQGKIVLIVGILFAIGFKIIGLPMAIVLGLFIGLLNFVPYLQIAGMIPALFLAALSSMTTGTPFWTMTGLVILVFCVVQLIQETILTPRIMGDLTGMNPAIILLSLSVWGSLLGITGMIIALPLTTIMLSYYKRFVLKEPEEGSSAVSSPD